MANFFYTIIRFFVSLLLTVGIVQSPYAQYTPIENRAYTDGIITADPEASDFVKITAEDEGFDIYNPEKGSSFGYRYGPSMIMNADGSIDAYFSAPGANDEWDWISYRHSPDGGKSWTEEKSVLQPTPDSQDFFSCCDPGIVKFGDYYYLGYTSTVVEGGVDNNVFVARSKNPDGPFEKWNGTGWGGKPEPIIVFTGNPEKYGAGEPSMVELEGTLYLYYTWRDDGVNQTHVAVADATDENWPATLEIKGIAMRHTYNDYNAMDSADVKYVEDWGRFIAVVTCDRFTTDSFVGLYVSDDGLEFRESNALKTNISHCCHNCGITGRPDGHIRLSDDIYIAYAYGDQWAYWPTRMNKVTLSQLENADFSDINNENIKTPVEFVKRTLFVDYIGITTEERVYEASLSDIFSSFKVSVLKADTQLNLKKVRGDVVFSDYDEDIIEIRDKRVYPKAVGKTYVTAQWQEHTVVFQVVVTE
ncbi:MAG: hypothetical protein IIU80_05965 [Clostridia bacterium]|nr:hypothetical protein [Clostridia bacterium]